MQSQTSTSVNSYGDPPSPTTCCYAKQTKFWVQGTPDGERWEVYTITDDAPAQAATEPAGEACCA